MSMADAQQIQTARKEKVISVHAHIMMRTLTRFLPRCRTMTKGHSIQDCWISRGYWLLRTMIWDRSIPRKPAELISQMCVCAASVRTVTVLLYVSWSIFNLNLIQNRTFSQVRNIEESLIGDTDSCIQIKFIYVQRKRIYTRTRKQTKKRRNIPNFNLTIIHPPQTIWHSPSPTHIHIMYMKIIIYIIYYYLPTHGLQALTMQLVTYTV